MRTDDKEELMMTGMRMRMKRSGRKAENEKIF